MKLLTQGNPMESIQTFRQTVKSRATFTPKSLALHFVCFFVWVGLVIYDVGIMWDPPVVTFFEAAGRENFFRILSFGMLIPLAIAGAYLELYGESVAEYIESSFTNPK